MRQVRPKKTRASKMTRREFCQRSVVGLGALTVPAWMLATQSVKARAATRPTIELRLGSTVFKAAGGIDPATGLPYKGLSDLFAEHFKPEQTGISVIPTDIVGTSVNDQHAKIVTLLLGGQIDIVLGSTLWPYYQQKLLVSLNRFYTRDNWRANYIPAIFTPPMERIMYPPWVANPTVYVSAPADLIVYSSAYDKQLFADFGVRPLSEPPTIDEIISKLPALTGKNPRTGQMCYGMYYNAGIAIHQMLYFLGHGDINFGTIDPRQPSKIAFDTPLIKSAIRQLITLAKYCPPGFVLGRGAENWGTNSNTIAMMLSVTPAGGGAAGMLTPILHQLTDRFVVTQGIRDKNNHTFFVSANEYGIASRSQNIDAAWEVLKFLSGPVAQKFMFENFRSLPSWKNQNWMTPATYPYAKPFLAAAAAARNAFFPQFMFSTFRPWLNATVSNAIAGKPLDLDADLARMQKQAEEWVVNTYTVQDGQVVPK